MDDAQTKNEKAFEMPSHCWWCGAYLMGGATKHARECAINKMIAQTFAESTKKNDDQRPRNQ